VLTAGTKAWAEAIKAKKRAKIFFIILAELSSSRGVCPTQDDERVEKITTKHYVQITIVCMLLPRLYARLPLLFFSQSTQVQDTLSGTETPIAYRA
jgi:hypothetical protein